MEPIVEVLSERALTENTLYIAPENYMFIGGYKARIEYYTYANEWGDKKHVKHFRTLENAEKFIDKMGLRY